jgi:hypothetical protein
MQNPGIRKGSTRRQPLCSAGMDILQFKVMSRILKQVTAWARETLPNLAAEQYMGQPVDDPTKIVDEMSEARTRPVAAGSHTCVQVNRWGTPALFQLSEVPCYLHGKLRPPLYRTRY